MSNDKAKAFHRLSKARYYSASRYPDLLDEFMVGVYYYEGGTDGEFGIRFKRIGSGCAPRLEAYDDSWGILAQWPELISGLAGLSKDGQTVTPDMVEGLLLSLGFQDFTMTEQNEPPISP